MSTTPSVIVVSLFIAILIMFGCHDLMESQMLHKIYSISTSYNHLILEHELSQQLSTFPVYLSLIFSAIIS